MVCHMLGSMHSVYSAHTQTGGAVAGRGVILRKHVFPFVFPLSLLLFAVLHVAFLLNIFKAKFL